MKITEVMSALVKFDKPCLKKGKSVPRKIISSVHAKKNVAINPQSKLKNLVGTNDKTDGLNVAHPTQLKQASRTLCKQKKSIKVVKKSLSQRDVRKKRILIAHM
jgi:hypothetical protein